MSCPAYFARRGEGVATRKAPGSRGGRRVQPDARLCKARRIRLANAASLAEVTTRSPTNYGASVWFLHGPLRLRGHRHRHTPGRGLSKGEGRLQLEGSNVLLGLRARRWAAGLRGGWTMFVRRWIVGGRDAWLAGAETETGGSGRPEREGWSSPFTSRQLTTPLSLSLDSDPRRGCLALVVI